MSVTVHRALAQAVKTLSASRSCQSDTAKLDAELLLAQVLGRSRSYLLSHPEVVLSVDQAQQFGALIAYRGRGEPVAYLLGERGFWTLDLQISPAVLIPRPETELLVELALGLSQDMASNQDEKSAGEQPALSVADLGTGSGAIALALASERPDWQIVATDISSEALAVAQQNARRLGLASVQFRQGNWCKALPAELRLDMIVSNPPYISESDPHLQQGDLRFEPRQALAAASDGLSDLCLIGEQSSDYLLPGGWLLLEHGHQQGAELRKTLAALGYEQIRTAKDLAGHERVTLARKPVSEVS